MRRLWVSIALLGALAAVAVAVERFPPPEFTDHELPGTTTPAPRWTGLEYLDVAVLFVALAAASFIALKLRSRKAMFVLMLACLGYFGFYRGGCVCPIGAVQNVAQAIFDDTVEIRPDPAGAGPDKSTDQLERDLRDLQRDLAGSDLHTDGGGLYVRARLYDVNRKALAEADAESWCAVERVSRLPWVVLMFFLLPLVCALLFGRTFCAAVCPLGAVQDLVGLRPLKIPRWLGVGLGLCAFVYLGLAVVFAATGSGYVICRYDPFVGFFRLDADFRMLILGACFMVVGVFLARPYCRFLCPYGVLLRGPSRLSKWHVTITPEECVKCRLCEDSCPYGAIRKANADQPSPARSYGRPLLAGLLLLLPVLTVAAGWLGSRLATPMSRVHPRIRLAERIRMEDLQAEQTGKATETTDASAAFRGRADARTDLLYAEALAIKGRFVTAGWIFGGFVGFMVGWTLIRLSVRRKREDYTPDRGDCVSCGRCFAYCPVERKRLKDREQPKTQ